MSTGWSTSLVFAFYTRYLNVSFFVVDVLSSPGSYGALEEVHEFRGGPNGVPSEMQSVTVLSPQLAALLAARVRGRTPSQHVEAAGDPSRRRMNVIPFPSAIFSVEGRRDDDTTVDQQALVVAAAGNEAHGSALEGSTPEPRAAAAGLESGGKSATPESDDSSSEGDDKPEPAPVSTGFKLNLGKVAANQVDDTKPVAVPHTPKGEVVQELSLIHI